MIKHANANTKKIDKIPCILHILYSNVKGKLNRINCFATLIFISMHKTQKINPKTKKKQATDFFRTFGETPDFFPDSIFQNFSGFSPDLIFPDFSGLKKSFPDCFKIFPDFFKIFPDFRCQNEIPTKRPKKCLV